MNASHKIYNCLLKDKLTDTKKKNVADFELYKPGQNEETARKITMPVQPLRTEEYIQKAKEYFLTKPERFKGQNIRDYTIFVMGINIARRCGDLLQLRVNDVLDGQNNIASYICIKEQKTGKTARLIVTPVIKEALEMYLSTFDSLNFSHPLFPSRNKDRFGNPKPMTLKNFYYKMQALKEDLSIADPIGTHTMRKTWAYLTLKNNPENSNIVAGISKALNHSDIRTTFRYLGIEQEEIDDLFMSNQL